MGTQSNPYFNLHNPLRTWFVYIPYSSLSFKVYKLVYCRLQKRLSSLKICMLIEYDFSYIVALMNTMKCKQTMYVGRLCSLKYGSLWVPINTFLLAQMSPNLARSIVRCYSSSCKILKSMR